MYRNSPFILSTHEQHLSPIRSPIFNIWPKNSTSVREPMPHPSVSSRA